MTKVLRCIMVVVAVGLMGGSVWGALVTANLNPPDKFSNEQKNQFNKVVATRAAEEAVEKAKKDEAYLNTAFKAIEGSTFLSPLGAMLPDRVKGSLDSSRRNKLIAIQQKDRITIHEKNDQGKSDGKALVTITLNDLQKEGSTWLWPQVQTKFGFHGKEDKKSGITEKYRLKNVLVAAGQDAIKKAEKEKTDSAKGNVSGGDKSNLLRTALLATVVLSGMGSVATTLTVEKELTDDGGAPEIPLPDPTPGKQPGSDPKTTFEFVDLEKICTEICGYNIFEDLEK